MSVDEIFPAGCTGGDESGSVIAYGLSELQDVDRDVEHPTPDGDRWIAVYDEVTEGKIPKGDLYGFTQIGVMDAIESARALDVEDDPLVAGDDGPPIEGGGGADI